MQKRSENRTAARAMTKACIAAARVACLREDGDLWAATVDICCGLDDGRTPAGPLVDAVLRAVVEHFGRE